MLGQPVTHYLLEKGHRVRTVVRNVGKARGMFGNKAEIKALFWRVEAYHHARRVDELQELAGLSAGLLPDPARAWRLQWLTQVLLANFAARREMDRQMMTVHEQSIELQRSQARCPECGPTYLPLTVKK